MNAVQHTVPHADIQIVWKEGRKGYAVKEKVTKTGRWVQVATVARWGLLESLLRSTTYRLTPQEIHDTRVALERRREQATAKALAQRAA